MREESFVEKEIKVDVSPKSLSYFSFLQLFLPCFLGSMNDMLFIHVLDLNF